MQGEVSKDSRGKPEGFSIGKPGTTIIPPFPSRHVNSSDHGYHSHLHSGRFSGKDFYYQGPREGCVWGVHNSELTKRGLTKFSLSMYINFAIMRGLVSRVMS